MPRDIQIRFVSSNPHKITEAQAILERVRIKVIPVRLKIEELQTTDTTKLLHDKLMKAFREIGRPLVVEHTGLYIDQARGLPGGLTQIFWDSLQADHFAQLFGSLADDTRATGQDVDLLLRREEDIRLRRRG